MDKKTYISKYWEDCKAACAGTPIFPLMAIAESAVESAWGSSFLTIEANNFFGIKSTPSWEADGGKFVIKPTHEVINHENIVVQAKFRKYDSPKDSFANYVHFVTQPGYVAAGVTKAATPEEQVACLQKEGYATDPHYAETIIAVMNGLKGLIN